MSDPTETYETRPYKLIRTDHNGVTFSYVTNNEFILKFDDPMYSKIQQAISDKHLKYGKWYMFVFNTSPSSGIFELLACLYELEEPEEGKTPSTIVYSKEKFKNTMIA